MADSQLQALNELAARRFHELRAAEFSVYRAVFPWFVRAMLDAGGSAIGDEPPPVFAVRQKARDAWKQLTGLPDLGEYDGWHAAAVAAGYLPPEFPRITWDKLVADVTAWGQVQAANNRGPRPRDATPAAAAHGDHGQADGAVLDTPAAGGAENPTATPQALAGNLNSATPTAVGVELQALSQWATGRLKGMQQRIVQLLANTPDGIPLADLAVDDGISWDSPFDDKWNSARKAINKKLKVAKLPFRLERHNNAARVKIMGQK